MTLDLSNVVLGAWLSVDVPPHEAAQSRLAHKVASSGQVIVLTEGSTDARWIRRSLELAAPDIFDSFTFLDFESTRAPGGVDRVVSLMRVLAAAQVMNRVIAVLNNDTAGRQGANLLAAAPLPDRMTVVNLPDVEHARDYPTVGPEGLSHSDVNGSAVTIEFMFGPSIVKREGGERAPIRWLSFIAPMGAYQGGLDVSDKASAASRISDALAAESLAELDSEVAEGCARLVRMLIAAAAHVTMLPASEFSPLPWGYEPCAG